MKKLILFLATFSFLSFGVNLKRIAISQYNSILYSDVIFHGKVTQSDSLGFKVKIIEAINNDTSNKNLLKNKEVFVDNLIPKKLGRYNSLSNPIINEELIFTLKYDVTTKKIYPLNRTFGLPIAQDKNASCYVTGQSNYEQINYKTVIKGIKLLRTSYFKTKESITNGTIKSKLSQAELTKIKVKNAAAKIWIQDIETKNEYYKKLEKKQ